MRKLFYAFMFAAVALLSGCTPDENIPEISLEDNYMGVEMNNCEVYYRGNYYNDGKENYVVFFENKNADGEVIRRVAFEITPSEVSADKIPVGTFSVADGTMKAGDISTGMLEGSYYLRMTESPFTMLIKGATLTITANDKGYFMEANINGDYDLNAEPELDEDGNEKEPSKLVDIECRFDGMPVMSGLDASGQFVEATPYAYFVYYDEVDGFAEWTFVAYDYNYYYVLAIGKVASLPAYASQFVIYTEIPEEGEEKVLPQGKFPIDGFNTGYLETALGSTVYIIDESGYEVDDEAYDGTVSISALGEGQYAINTTMYCFNDAYKINHEGVIYFKDATEVAMYIDPTDSENGTNGLYLDWQENIGGDHWIMTAVDSTNGIMMELHLYGEEGADTASGVPSGTYTVSDTKAAGTVGVGVIGDDGVSGSLLYDAQGNIFAVLTDGEITVNNSGDGTYSIVFEFDDHNGIYYYGSGRCSSVGISYPSLYKPTAASGIFVGDGGWYIDVIDMTKAYGQGMMLRTLLISDADITYADGVPCEKFRFDTSGNPGTAMAGTFISGAGYYYSMVMAADASGLYALLVGGDVEITKNGNDYVVAVNAYDESGNIHRGTFTGAISTIDGTADDEASAPAKVQSVVEWSNYNAKKLVDKQESKFGPFKTYDFKIVK